MKIGIFAPEIKPNAGGAYTFARMLLAEISHAKSESNHEFVILASTDLSVDNMISIKLPKLNNGLLDKFVLVLLRIIAMFKGKSLPDNSARIAKRINRQIRDLGIDVVWCLASNSIIFEVPYVTTIWDLEHWNKSYFPEFNLKPDLWVEYENHYSLANSRATLLVVGTQTGANQLNNIYGIPQEKILINPFPVVPTSKSNSRDPNLILYPAQFWPHKNHLLLLKAIAQLPDAFKHRVRLALTGSDQGNLGYIKQKIFEYGLTRNVEIMGFVSEEELQGLYSTARITIFPSYFGPDNLPPLESLSHGTLTAVADISGARDYLGDSVIYFPPNDVTSVSSIILQAIKDANWGLEKNKTALEFFKDRTWRNYFLRIDSFFDEFSLVRENWK